MHGWEFNGAVWGAELRALQHSLRRWRSIFYSWLCRSILCDWQGRAALLSEHNTEKKKRRPRFDSRAQYPHFHRHLFLFWCVTIISFQSLIRLVRDFHFLFPMTCHIEQHCFLHPNPVRQVEAWCRRVNVTLCAAICQFHDVGNKVQQFKMTGCLLLSVYHRKDLPLFRPLYVFLTLSWSQTWAPLSVVLSVGQGWRFQSPTPGTYKSEENQLLLKVYQVKGPTQHYISKFKNDNWAMDGYVSGAAGAAGCLFSAWFFS